ncbi:MAG: hypothetical protein AAEJ52_02300, partial [Myxococcota bacterium]
RNRLHQDPDREGNDESQRGVGTIHGRLAYRAAVTITSPNRQIHPTRETLGRVLGLFRERL